MLISEFFGDYITYFFFMLIEVEMVAAERYNVAGAVCEALPAVHVNALEHNIVKGIENGDIAVKFHFIGSNTETVRHTHIRAEQVMGEFQLRQVLQCVRCLPLAKHQLRLRFL